MAGGPLNAGLAILYSLFSCANDFPTVFCKAEAISGRRPWGLSEPCVGPHSPLVLVSTLHNVALPPRTPRARPISPP